MADVARRHRELIATCHPDRYAQASSQERRIAVETSATLNDALKVLCDPLQRARYLLQIRGVQTNEETDVVMDPAFLAEQLAWRERFEEDRADAARVQALVDEHAQLTMQKQEELRRCLRSGHADTDQQARRLVRELQFLRRFGEELDDASGEI
ncbi:MAG: Fe-S protein assembly co-chaperone HscB [Acidiferrobacter sp.]